MIRYFGSHDLPTLATTGYLAGKNGPCAIWAWIKAGHTIDVRIGRTAAQGVASGRKAYSWTHLKTVTLRKNASCKIEMTGADAAAVPLIAVCSSPSDDPSKHHALTHAHYEHPDPMPDARAAVISGVHTPQTLKLGAYDSLNAWQAKSKDIREHILTTFGLSGGFPTNPLRQRIFGKIEREGYTVEKVEFQSLPGFYCYGNLYRPTAPGPHPGVLCPHGHCRNGRFEDSDEAFASIPGRCINLARQGHVTFSYDMVGYNDSWQLPHREFGGRLEDLWGIGIMGLQLINSSRSIDFLQSLPDVDPDRIGCTGASGGGTQTFMLTAIDDRIKVSAPVNMISAQMQGGCNCENQAGLRIDLNNIEIASTMAPRPMIMVSATGDWTVNTPELEYPAIRDIYRLYDAEDRIASAQVDAGHNYNRESREHVYAWFAKWLLGIDDPERFKERPFQMESRPHLRVTHRRPQPSNALTPAGLEHRIHSDSSKQAIKLLSSRAQTRDALRRILRVDPKPRVSSRNLGRTRTSDHIIKHKILTRDGEGDRIPLMSFSPRSRNRGTVVLLQSGGKADLYTGSGKPGVLIKSLLSGGFRVLAPDLFLTGESARYNAPDRENHDRHFAAYNLTDAQCRIQDIVTVATYAAKLGGRVHIAALKGAGVDALLARPFLPRITSTCVDVSGTRVDQDAWWGEHIFIPGIRTIGDIVAPTLLTAPARLAVFGTGTGFPSNEIRKQYRHRKGTGNLTLSKVKMIPDLLVKTLTQ